MKFVETDSVILINMFYVKSLKICNSTIINAMMEDPSNKYSIEATLDDNSKFIIANYDSKVDAKRGLKILLDHSLQDITVWQDMLHEADSE